LKAKSLSDQHITLNQLESHLWESANILRGPVDAADFKTYIFPLLFFKRICDVWDEEYQDIVDETGDEQLAWFPESHRFQIPEDCHWNDVRTKPSNVGTALQRAMREIEKANPDTLYGVFGDAQWSNKERLSDALLKDLIEHFSGLPFGNKNVNSDLLGDAYEYLIKKFADATNKKAGEFYTPRSVVRLMIDMLDPKEVETIYDPACGTGGMLLAAVQHVKEQHGDVKRLWGKLYGQEKNLTTSSIARMNLFLHGIEDFQVVRGDTLRNPAFFEVDRLATFDCVIANPPFSLKKWGEDLWLNDPFGRNFAGLPPSSSGDFAWVQHMVKSMADVTGRMAVVLPQGALFRKSVEGSIRQKLLEMDLVEAVIGLAPNLFYGTGLAACILVASPNNNSNPTSGAPPCSCAAHRCGRLQAVHLPAAVLQAAVRRVRRGDAGRAGRVRRRPALRRLPENHRFQIPAEAHWREVRQAAKMSAAAFAAGHARH
jgi:type I restriction enzyme M protein